MHLVGFIIGIYHDARSSECQKKVYQWFYLFTLYLSLLPSQFHGLWFVACDGRLIQNDELQRAGKESIVSFHIALVPCCEISHYVYINKSAMIRFSDIQNIETCSKTTWFGLFGHLREGIQHRKSSCLSTFPKMAEKTTSMMFITCFCTTLSNHSRVTVMYNIDKLRRSWPIIPLHSSGIACIKRVKPGNMFRIAGLSAGIWKGEPSW